jgi:hypothetical protein
MEMTLDDNGLFSALYGDARLRRGMQTRIRRELARRRHYPRHIEAGAPAEIADLEAEAWSRILQAIRRELHTRFGFPLRGSQPDELPDMDAECWDVIAGSMRRKDLLGRPFWPLAHAIARGAVMDWMRQRYREPMVDDRADEPQAGAHLDSPEAMLEAEDSLPELEELERRRQQQTERKRRQRRRERDIGVS